MSENAPETDLREPVPTSAGMLLVEGLALTVLVVSFLRRLISFLTASEQQPEPLRSHYLPPDVTTGGEFGGGSVRRGQPAYVTIKPGQTLGATMSIKGHISYNYEDATGPHAVVISETFTFLGTQINPFMQYVIQTDTSWQTLTVTVYTQLFDSNALQQSSTDLEPIHLQ